MTRARQACTVVIGATVLALTLLPPPRVRAASTSALLISSVATGGSAAADEYVVIEAVGDGGATIADYELVYTTASGTTTRRLASFESATPLAAGARLLVANGLGSFSAGAFATWSEGIAATGGAIRLRQRGVTTTVADAVSWGSATSSAGGFGTPTPAMSSSTMIERRRGVDLMLVNTQSSLADFSLVPLAPPSLITVVLSTPTPTATPAPTATPTPTPRTLTPSEVRVAPLNSTVTMRGTVSAAPGELAEDRLFCVEDEATGSGMFVLAQNGDTDLARGDVVAVTGKLQLRRQALTVTATGVVQVDGGGVPRGAADVVPPTPGAWAWEPWEGRHIQVTGTVGGAVTELSGGARSLTLRLPTGGELLVGLGVSVADQIPEALLASKVLIRVRGVLHQRSGSAGGGYRLWALTLASSLPRPPVKIPTSVTPRNPPSSVSSRVPVLAAGAPSIAIPSGARPWWVRRVSQAFEVRGGSLKQKGPDGVALVVLPACPAAQAVPRRTRAGERVDRAGRAAYPQLR